VDPTAYRQGLYMSILLLFLFSSFLDLLSSLHPHKNYFLFHATCPRCAVNSPISIVLAIPGTLSHGLRLLPYLPCQRKSLTQRVPSTTSLFRMLLAALGGPRTTSPEPRRRLCRYRCGVDMTLLSK
jgi:hypothetical protein